MYLLTILVVNHCPKMRTNNFFLSSLPTFLQGLGGQQLKINPPYFTVFGHIHHFAWVMFEVITPKILNVIGPSSSRPSNLGFPICFAK